jgi:hypothetical protein
MRMNRPPGVTDTIAGRQLAVTEQPRAQPPDSEPIDTHESVGVETTSPSTGTNVETMIATLASAEPAQALQALVQLIESEPDALSHEHLGDRYEELIKRS